MRKNVAFITMGCAKNEADSSSMQQDLLRSGYSIVSPDEPCDALIVNTCSFIQSAIEESLDVIFNVADEEAIRSGATKLVVCGCLPSRFGEALEGELTEADLFVPCNREDDIVSILDELLENEESVQNSSITFDFELSEYVKISDGCSRHCSFCTIPAIRGPYHSFTYDEVFHDVQQKVDAGTREIVLIAQDSGLWGLDLTPRDTLAHLLERLAVAFPDTWFRVMYLQPAGMTDELMDVVARYSNICSYFDIPLQHCDPQILKSMNRSGNRAQIEETIKRIRQRVPNVSLRTTLIVGYPGETEEQFEDLCDFVSTVEFDYVGIFPYSPEEGTPAALLPNQIDDQVKQDRYQELRDLADTISASKISERIGLNSDVLILGTEEDGQLFGRCQSQAPEVDGVTYVDDGSIGQIVSAVIDDTLLYEMEATRG